MGLTLPQPLSSSVPGVKLRAGSDASCGMREEGNYLWWELKDGDTEREREKKRVRKSRGEERGAAPWGASTKPSMRGLG